MKIVAWSIVGLPRRRWWRWRPWRRRRRVWLALSEPVELPPTSTPLTIQVRDL